MIDYIDKIRLKYFKGKLAEIFAALTHTHSVSDITDFPNISSTANSAASSAVSTHNTSSTAHADIRNLVSALTTKVNNFLNVDDETKDELSEIIELIENNQDLIEGITTSKVNVKDIIANLTTNDGTKPLAASQGVVLKGLIDDLQEELDSHSGNTTIHITSTERTNWNDANSKKHSHSNKTVLDGITSALITAWNNAVTHISDTVAHITAAERTKWDAASTHANSTHAPSNATVVADSTTNGNVLINGEEVNVYTHPSGTNPHGTTKSDVGLGNANNTSDADKPVSTAQQEAIDAVQDNLDSHTSNKSNPHGVTKSQVGLGNVANVTTNNQTPTYTQASTLATLVSGETLSVSMGKIMKAITDLISHIGNTSNPHSVTKSQIGLGSVENKSSATIRGELTKENVTDALGYTPPETNTDTVYTHPSYTARTGVPTTNQTPAFGGTFQVTQPVSDATGHITGMNSRTVTIPNAVASTSAPGLCPKRGGTTTKFLRDDGTWAVPPDTDTVYTHPASGATAGSYGDSAAQTPAYGGTFKVPYVTVDANGHVTGISEHTVKIPASDNSDTKNTAGSTNSSSKLFLIGATSQAANPQTYSHDTAYVGTDGHLYSDSKQVVNLSGSQALTNKTYNGYTLAAACAKGVATSVTSGGTSLPTAGAVYTALENLLGADITESDISSIIS